MKYEEKNKKVASIFHETDLWSNIIAKIIIIMQCVFGKRYTITYDKLSKLNIILWPKKIKYYLITSK